MACRVCEDAPATAVCVQQRGAEFRDLNLGRIEIRHLEVQMKLLRVRAVRPPRRAVVLHALKREHKAGSEVEGREVVADGPPGIWLIDRPASQRLVETAELADVRAVQDYALQLADH